MSDPIRVGLIGYGYASKTFHAPLVSGTPGMTLAAVSSSDETKVLADWPAVKVVTAPQALFSDPDIDLVVIPTPNDTHFPLAKAALEAGKHVVVDKPFTVTLSQARELEAIAKSEGRLLSVFHNRRWDSDFLTVKSLINEGLLGEVGYFESHFDRYRPLSTAGTATLARARWAGQRHLVRSCPASAGPGGKSLRSAGEYAGRPGSATAWLPVHRLFSCGVGLAAASRGAARNPGGRGGNGALYHPRFAGKLCEIRP